MLIIYLLSNLKNLYRQNKLAQREVTFPDITSLVTALPALSIPPAVEAMRNVGTQSRKWLSNADKH